jgi:NAD(P)H dehydrogenase (quinone)
MAAAVPAGVVTVAGSHATLKTPEEATSGDVGAADALILGPAVHMGSMDWRVKRRVP